MKYCIDFPIAPMYPAGNLEGQLVGMRENSRQVSSFALF